jgi:hypothetical protein
MAMMECLENVSSSSVGTTFHDEPLPPLQLLATGHFHLAAIVKSFSTVNAS